MLITITNPSVEILTPLGVDTLKFLELAGRVCYKSEDRITKGSAEKFVRMIVKNGHESVLEHINATARIIGSRSMSHQLVRHRVGTVFSQESQRYINYGKRGFQVVCPPKIGIPCGPYYFSEDYTFDFFMDETMKEQYPDHWFTATGRTWLACRADNYLEYLYYLKKGIPPEDARECLPNATKTELVMTCNLRQWRHVFAIRALNKHAQWQIRQLMQGVLIEFGKALPAVFGDQMLQINAE
jgi:thymidylate synthase (FAD)